MCRCILKPNQSIVTYLLSYLQIFNCKVAENYVMGMEGSLPAISNNCMSSTLPVLLMLLPNFSAYLPLRLLTYLCMELTVYVSTICPILWLPNHYNFTGQLAKPQCHQMYNLFYSSDPTAVRLEPLLNDKFKFIPPLKLPRYNKFPFGDGIPIHTGKKQNLNSSY